MAIKRIKKIILTAENITFAGLDDYYLEDNDYSKSLFKLLKSKLKLRTLDKIKEKCEKQIYEIGGEKIANNRRDIINKLMPLLDEEPFLHIRGNDSSMSSLIDSIKDSDNHREREKIIDRLADGRWEVKGKIEKIINKYQMYKKNIKDIFVSIINNADKPILLSERSLDGSKKTFCYYDGGIYKVDHQYSLEEIKLLIFELEDRERKKFEKLKKKMEIVQEIEKQPKREQIPEEVRIAVWRRDEGKCVKCDSRDKLEYDHIIPVSKGGSNTVRNIELLCEACNRRKKDKIE